MNGCEGYEVAIEMRIHGALDYPSTAKLDSHLDSCPHCKAFADACRTTDKGLRIHASTTAEEIDWDGLQQRFHRLVAVHRRRIFIPAAAIIGLLAAQCWSLLMWGSNWRSALAPGELKADVAVFLGGWIFFAWYHRARMRAAHRAMESQQGLIEFCRQELGGKIRSLRRLRRAFLVVGSLCVFGTVFGAPDETTFGLRVLESFLALAMMIGPAAFIGFVLIPPLDRARAELG